MARLPMIVFLVCIGFVAVIGDTDTSEDSLDSDSVGTEVVTDAVDEDIETQEEELPIIPTEGDFYDWAQQIFNPNVLGQLGGPQYTDDEYETEETQQEDEPTTIPTEYYSNWAQQMIKPNTLGQLGGFMLFPFGNQKKGSDQTE